MKCARTKQQQTLHQPLRASPVLAPQLRKACSHLSSSTGRISTSIPLSLTSASLCPTNHFNMVQTHLLLSHLAGGLAEYNTTNTTTLKITMTKSMLAWKRLNGNRTENAGWTENMQNGQIFPCFILDFFYQYWYKSTFLFALNLSCSSHVNLLFTCEEWKER